MIVFPFPLRGLICSLHFSPKLLTQLADYFTSPARVCQGIIVAWQIAGFRQSLNPLSACIREKLSEAVN